MALISVRRVIIEEIAPDTNEPIVDGTMFVIDCNENADISEYFLPGEEKHYTNNNQTVAYNLTSNINYGYDITLNLSDFDLMLYAFLSNNTVYFSGGQKNLFGIGRDNDVVQYDNDVNYVKNYVIWGVNHIQPALVAPAYYPYNAMQTSSQHGFRSSGVNPDRVGFWNTFNTFADIGDTNIERFFVTFDDDRQPDRLNDDLKLLRQKIESGQITYDRERRYWSLKNGGYYMFQKNGVGGFNTTSSYYVDSLTLRGFYQFGVMQSFSLRSLNGNNNSRWPCRSVPGITYNFMCVLESSNNIAHFNYDESEEPYDIARFYSEMHKLPDGVGNDILINTYIYITLNPNARAMVAGFGDDMYTDDYAIATSNYNTVRNFVNNDDQQILFGSLFEFEPYFTGGRSVNMESDHLGKSLVLRKSVNFNTADEFYLSSFIFFMPTQSEDFPWTPPTDSTPAVLRMGIPFKSPTWYTLVPQVVPANEQSFVLDTYGVMDQELYNREMQGFISGESESSLEGLVPGGMKSRHSSISTYTNLFKTTIFSERYKGTEMEGYYKMEFPVCYADPPSININNNDFSQLNATIHAREDFYKKRSSVYINPVSTLDD